MLCHSFFCSFSLIWYRWIALSTLVILKRLTLRKFVWCLCMYVLCLRSDWFCGLTWQRVYICEQFWTVHLLMTWVWLSWLRWPCVVDRTLNSKQMFNSESFSERQPLDFSTVGWLIRVLDQTFSVVSSENFITTHWEGSGDTLSFLKYHFSLVHPAGSTQWFHWQCLGLSRDRPYLCRQTPSTGLRHPSFNHCSI